MAKPNGPVSLWSQYLAARLAVMGLTMFDVEANLRTAAQIGRLLYRFDHRHRLRAINNLTTSFPDLNRKGIDQLCLGSFEHFVQLLVEIIHTPRLLHQDSWPARAQLHNLSETVQLLNANRPTILITGHLGNWEVLGYMLAVLGYPLEAIARPIDNPLVNRWLLDIRQRHGMRIITKWDATEQMVEVLRGGGSLGFIADQNAGDKGMFVPFFGRLASTYKSIGLLAMRENVPIICGYAHRTGRDYKYDIGVMDLIRPDDWAEQEDPLYYITARYSRAIEMMICLRPHQYLWMHRRWKSRPRFERRGTPMPASLQRNLEGLPWMDQPTLDQLLNPSTKIDNTAR